MSKASVRPRLQPRLLVIWAVFALLLIGVIIYDYLNDAPTVRLDHHGHAASSHNLLPVPIEQIGVIEIAQSNSNNQQIHRFERDEQGDWLYHNHAHKSTDPRSHQHDTQKSQHQADPVIAARISEAFAVLNRARIERDFLLTANIRDYGLVKPDILINVYANNKSTTPLARYAVGDIAPDTFSRYILLVGRFKIITIPNYHIDNLLSMIEAVNTQTTANQ